MTTPNTTPKAVAALVANVLAVGRKHGTACWRICSQAVATLEALAKERDDYHRKACDIADDRDDLRARLEDMDSRREELDEMRIAAQSREARLREALEHIQEYWNRDANETAMSDALWHIIDTCTAALAQSQDAKCRVCGTKLEISPGWVPTPNDPDNAGLAPMAEPYCPSCDADARNVEGSLRHD